MKKTIILFIFSLFGGNDILFGQSKTNLESTFSIDYIKDSLIQKTDLSKLKPYQNAHQIIKKHFKHVKNVCHKSGYDKNTLILTEQNIDSLINIDTAFVQIKVMFKQKLLLEEGENAIFINPNNEYGYYSIEFVFSLIMNQQNGYFFSYTFKINQFLKSNKTIKKGNLISGYNNEDWYYQLFDDTSLHLSLLTNMLKPTNQK